MFKLGICVRHFGFNDGTDRAIALATKLCSLQSVSVAIYSQSPPAKGFADGWLSKVSFPDIETHAKWCERQSAVVWSFFDPNTTPKVIEGDKKRPHHFALDWFDISKPKLGKLKRFANIVAPERNVHRWFNDRLARLDIPVIPWTSDSVAARKRYGQEDYRMIYVPFSGQSSDPIDCVCHSLDVALHKYKDLRIVLSSYRSVEKAHRKAIQRLMRQHSTRVKYIHRPSRMERNSIIRMADWVLWPSVAESSGYLGSEALACGTPVIGFDVPLVSNVIKSRCNGYLLECDIAETSMHVPVAIPSMHHLIEGLDYVLASRMLLDDVYNQEWPETMQRDTSFLNSWSHVLGVV